MPGEGPSAASSFLQLVDGAAASRRGLTVLDGDNAHRRSWTEFHDDATRAAAVLQQRGIGPGSLVCVIGDTSDFVLTGIAAAILAGACISVVGLPIRSRSEDALRRTIRDRLLHASPDLVIADQSFASVASPGFATLTESDLAASISAVTADAYDAPRVTNSELAMLQFTSGSTADSKGVIITHGQLAHNITASVAAAFEPDSDVMVSWLPLYHDMGLIGCFLLSMAVGMELVLASPMSFFLDPGSWLRNASNYRATMIAGPNFAYAVAARHLTKTEVSIDLSAVRIAFNGAEPIDPDSVEAFTAAAGRFGFDPNAMLCVYGLAEATLAVAFPRPGSGLEVDVVDADVLEQQHRAVTVGDGRAKRLVRLGSPIPGMDLRIVTPDGGAPLGEREVGEIEVRGPSTTLGYFRNPDDTAALYRDGWMRTGDLGYLAEGELVVCGRLKDIVIVGGRNILPEDVERAAGSVAGVREGNVVAFAVPGPLTERVVVVAERRRAGDLRRAVEAAVLDAVGVTPHNIVFVRPGSLPKTSSGKLQRSACRRLYQSDALEIET